MQTTFSIRKFNLLTIFTLTNSLNCFFYKNLITLLVSKPEKTDGCSRSSRSFTCLIFDSRSRWRGNWKFLSQRSIPTFPSKAVISSSWMTCLINLKKHALDPVWLFDDQKLIPTFFSKVKNSFWCFRKSDRVETWNRVRQTRSMWYLACMS